MMLAQHAAANSEGTNEALELFTHVVDKYAQCLLPLEGDTTVPVYLVKLLSGLFD